MLELQVELDAADEAPDTPAEIADAVSAIRLTTSAALAAGPVLFETLDGRPFGIRPVLPIAATQPPGEPSRLDAFRTPIAVEVLAALGDADGDPELAEALDRWELSLFQNEPFRSEQLRASLGALLGETWPLRCAVLLAQDGGGREELHGHLTALAGGDAATRASSTRLGGRSWPRCGRATGSSSCTSSIASSSGSAAAPRAVGGRRSSSADAAPDTALDTDSAHNRYPAAQVARLRSLHGGSAGGAGATGADRGARPGGRGEGRAAPRAARPARGGRGVVERSKEVRPENVPSTGCGRRLPVTWSSPELAPEEREPPERRHAVRARARDAA